MSTAGYSIDNIAEIVQAAFIKRGPSTSQIVHLLTDSRKVIAPDQSLFFAIKGDRHDGHQYIDELIQNGVKNFIVEGGYFPSQQAIANFLTVENSIDAIQKLAAYHRRQFKLKTIGITGSNGKTIIKEWLFQLLREHFNIVRSPKSFNSQIGVPLSVWQINDTHQLGIFEAGISKPDEMDALEEIILPNIGIISNIGTAHDENFKFTNEKISEKLKLFKHSDVLIFCKDYTNIAQVIEENYSDLKSFKWSKKTKADLQIGRFVKGEDETEIQGIYKNEFITIKIPFSDDASIENAIHCWALMLYLEISNEEIASRMEQLSPVAMRLEMKEGINNCSIINDTYNSDIGSLTIALDFMNQQHQQIKKTLILSDILESGKDELKLYQEVAELIHKKGIHRLIGIGSALSRQQSLFNLSKSFYLNTEAFLHELKTSDFIDQTILVKGARSFGFERISKALQQKAHETVLEINLNAAVHNLNLFRSRLKPDTKLMVMVKAFSYGSGSYEIANVMQFHRVDYLAVAYADEGVALRKAGISLPIMVMNPEEQSFDAIIQYQLEPDIYSFRILNLFTEAIKRNAKNNYVAKFPVHIEIDTGMHRLGFGMDEINELIIRIKNNKYIKIRSLFSHLVAADELEHDVYTRKQIEDFNAICSSIKSHFNYEIIRHILNSSGIIRFPEAQLDMVRLGIGLHGIASSVNEQRQLQMVATLKTTISQLRQVKAGDSIGYSRKAIAGSDMLIATVGIGYADGLNRNLGNGVGAMFVDGQQARIVGNICMDMTMIDVTGMNVREGQDVIVFGNDYSVIEMAKHLKTIPYEVLTGISERVKRVYYQE